MFLSTSFFAYAFDSFSIVKIYCGGMEQRYPGSVDRPWRFLWPSSGAGLPTLPPIDPVRRGCPDPTVRLTAGLRDPGRAKYQPARFMRGHRKVESIPPALKRPVPRPLPVALKSRDQSGSLTYDQCDGWGAIPERPQPMPG